MHLQEMKLATSFTQAQDLAPEGNGKKYNRKKRLVIAPVKSMVLGPPALQGARRDTIWRLAEQGFRYEGLSPGISRHRLLLRRPRRHRFHENACSSSRKTVSDKRNLSVYSNGGSWRWLWTYFSTLSCRFIEGKYRKEEPGRHFKMDFSRMSQKTEEDNAKRDKEQVRRRNMKQKDGWCKIKRREDD